MDHLAVVPVVDDIGADRPAACSVVEIQVYLRCCGIIGSMYAPSEFGPGCVLAILMR
jgi:hypothetical protein